MNLNEQWRWTPDLAPLLRFPFEGSEQIATNQSQAWQDLFVLSALRGKRGGTYLEVGGQFPVDNSNTCVLHDVFGWHGVSIEWDAQFVPYWAQQRPAATFLSADALAIDYAESMPRWFPESNRIDYLQLDIDPSINTLAVLKRLPLGDFRFSVITFETDAYAGDPTARNESREILSSHGYELVAPDVCVLWRPASPNPIPFEDWWVDPQAVDGEIRAEIRRLTTAPLMPQSILFSENAR